MSSTMTKEERELLDSVFADSADSGEKLYIHQEEALRQLRGAMAYLKEKYPSHQIGYRMFDPLTKITEKGILVCFSEDRNEEFRTVIRREADYTYSDTLYGILIREAYDRELEILLAPHAGPLQAHTDFYTPRGTETGENLSVRELNAIEPVITRHTGLFVTDSFVLTDDLKEALAKERFFGSYTVYLSPGTEYLNFQVFGDGSGEGGGL